MKITNEWQEKLAKNKPDRIKRVIKDIDIEIKKTNVRFEYHLITSGIPHIPTITIRYQDVGDNERQMVLGILPYALRLRSPTDAKCKEALTVMHNKDKDLEFKLKYVLKVPFMFGDVNDERPKRWLKFDNGITQLGPSVLVNLIATVLYKNTNHQLFELTSENDRFSKEVVQSYNDMLKDKPSGQFASDVNCDLIKGIR